MRGGSRAWRQRLGKVRPVEQMEARSQPSGRRAGVHRVSFETGEAEFVRAEWSGFELAWGRGFGAPGDFGTPAFGLNISFLGQDMSRSRTGNGTTLERPLAPADVVLNSGDSLLWVENPAAFEGLNIGLEPGLLDRFGALNGVAVPELRPTYFHSDPRLLDIARIVADEMRTGSGGPLVREALLNLLLAHLVERYGVSPGSSERGRLAGRRLKAVLDHIDDRLESGSSLAELAKLAGMSSFHFARQFKLATGLPPHRYVTLRRMKRARSLLSDPGLSIAQVAFAVGYSDARHFAEQFRRATGRSPAKFRKESG